MKDCLDHIQNNNLDINSCLNNGCLYESIWAQLGVRLHHNEKMHALIIISLASREMNSKLMQTRGSTAHLFIPLEMFYIFKHLIRFVVIAYRK